MNKETQKLEFEMNSSGINMMSSTNLPISESTMEIVMKNIYSSCDPHNSNQVSTSAIIEFIRPYMTEDLSALETLRNMLDPEDKNLCINNDEFYNVMNEWAKKITSHSDEDNSDGEFNRSPSQLNNIDQKLLPYTHSTPRASFGQKLLSCQDLLNLSNVSNYNTSPSRQTKDNSIVGQERTILEEEVKQLHYELTKVTGEVTRLKVQLAYSEEQNEYLHDELEKLRNRLHSEHQPNGHLHENKNCVEDIKEEISTSKKQLEELNTKLTIYEKENNHLNEYVQKLEKENSELEDRCLQLSKTELTLKNQLIDIKTELDMKEHELTSVTKIGEELRLKLYEKNNEVDQLLNEKELLDYKKQGLEKMLSSRRYSLTSHYKTCLDEMSSFNYPGSTIPIYSPLKNESSYSYNSNSPSFIKQVLSPISPNPNDPNSKMLNKVLQNSTPKRSNGLGMRKAISLNAMSTRSLPNIFCSEPSNVVQDQVGDSDVILEPMLSDLVFTNGPYESLQKELFKVDPDFDHKDKNGTDLEYEEQINSLKSEIDSLQNKLQTLVKENRMLTIESKTCSDRIKDLDGKVNTLLLDKKSLEQCLSNTQENKTETDKIVSDLENKLKDLKDDYDRLKTELIKKDKQIDTQIDFESAYKRLESEYGSKIALLEELQHNYENGKNAIVNLTNKNKDMEKVLKDCKAELEETKEKLKHRDTLSSNIEQTANKVQAHVDGNTKIVHELQKLNIEFKFKIEQLQTDLQEKIKQLGYMKEILIKEDDIKDKMWNDNQDLTLNLNVLTEDYQKLLKEVGQQEDVKKLLREEYNTILSKYNEEIEKSRQVSSQNEEFTKIHSEYEKINQKYKQEINKNLKILEELSYLKFEVENIRENHKMCKHELNKSLFEFQKSLKVLCTQIKHLDFENNLLKTDLNIEKPKLCKQICDENFDSKIKESDYDDNGVKSEAEMEDKCKKYLDCDVSSDSSLVSVTYDKSTFPVKNRSFERQNLTIHKLRERLEESEEFLRHEQSKSEILLKRLNTKEEELRTVKNRLISEKNSLQAVINDLQNKLRQQEDSYKHLCNASNKKIKEVSLKLAQIDELHKNDLLNLSQKDDLLQRNFEMNENNKLTIEKLYKSLQDFQDQTQNLTGDLKTKEISLKNIAVENQNLKHFQTRLENQVLELSAKLSYKEIALKHCESELSKKGKELTSLSTLLLNKEERIKKLIAVAEDYEHKLSNTLPKLTAQDSNGLHVEEELKAFQEKMSKTDIANTISPTKIGPYAENIKSGENKNANDESALEKISGFMKNISECCNDLNMAFTKFIEQWKNKLETVSNFAQPLPTLKLCTSLEVDHVLSVIVNNIKAIIVLFNILCSNTSSTMQDSTESPLDYLINTKVEVNEPKVIKKFTLRPSNFLLSRSVSPDSPGLEMEPHNNDKSKPKAINASPDSQSSTIEIAEKKEDCLSNASSTLQLLSFDLQVQDAFPDISDTLLDKLGLHENSPKVTLTKDETEKLFTALAIQMALDSKNIKGRLQKQQNFCSQQHRKCIYLLRDISLRLRDHKCIGAIDPINPVFVMLEDIRFQIQELLQAVGQLGILTCENRMRKCWNLVTNYVAIIRQNSEYWKEQTSPTSSRFSPGGRKSIPDSPVTKNMSLEKCQNCEKQNRDKDTKATKECSEYSCCSRFTHILGWLAFLPLLFFIGIILVHWQCKMNTDYKICPLDDFIKVLSESVGNPPY